MKRISSPRPLTVDLRSMATDESVLAMPLSEFNVHVPQ
jgi:hypothetical protein